MACNMFLTCFGRRLCCSRTVRGADRAETEDRAEGAASPAAASGASSGVTGRSGLNASRICDMQPEQVTVCDARDIMDGLCMQPRQLGRGSFGIVVPGSYRGVSCAIKIMLSPAGLDQAAVKELLLSPKLVHPNVVSTFASRCAHLTNDFFDLLEGERDVSRDPELPRLLAPVDVKSGDGFGDPKGVGDGTDPLVVLHQALYALGAEVGQMVVVVVQECCDRGTLDNAIRKNIFRPMPPWGLRIARRALLRTAAEVARGLLHLHDSGVVHGDLKPANILLRTSREDRRGFVIKVADFGLSHVLPSAANSLDTDDCWGSIPYMAPEGFDGRVSRATDVWAFGVLLWEMLTGQRPYEGRHQAEVIIGVREGRLQLPWPEGAPMAGPIIALGRRCLSRDPHNRPRLDEVIQALVDIERGIREELLLGQQLRESQHQQQQQQQDAVSATVPGAAADGAGGLHVANAISGLVIL